VRVRLLRVAVLVLFSMPYLPAASAQTATNRSAAVERVRHLYFNQDDEPASKEAEDLVAKNPKDLELKAWYAVSGRRDKTQPVVMEMLKTDPESAWTLLAKAAAFANGWEMKGQCEKAVTKAPDDEDLLLLATRLLIDVLDYAHGDHEAKAFQENLASFLDSHRSGLEKSGDGLAARAQALQSMETMEPDKARQLEMRDLCDRALKMDGKNVAAAIIKAHWLSSQQKRKEAYDLLKSSAQAVPDSFALHLAYWNSVLNEPGNTAANQTKEIVSDAVHLFATVKPNQEIIMRSATELEKLPEAVKGIGDLILKQFPDTDLADAVLLARAMHEDPTVVAEPDNPEQVHALEEFLDRPRHFDDHLVKRANEQLAYLLAKSEHPDLDRLYKAVMGQDGEDAEGIAVLAEHKVHLPELEMIATKQLDAQWKVTYSRMLNQTDNQGFLDFAMSTWVSPWQSALGWVYFNEGKLDEAQEKIEAALKINEKSAESTIRLGRVYEAKGQIERAGQLYTEALSMFSSEEEHPAVKALRESYVRRHGNTAGLDAYMKPILAKDRERRRKDVLKARIASPVPIPAFSLTGLDGKTVTSESLKGKFLVINFWATWCGPCRKELPDYDKFYQQYKDDPNVVVLTAATDSADTPQKDIQDFVAKRKFTFPVLLAPEWAKQNHIEPIPMTWFVDANGKKEFQKIGYSKELMEEFSWRVEAMQKGSMSQTEKSSAAKE